MKLIHLSDLHLGKRVNEFSMIEDQEYILNQILDIIDREHPAGVLIAGDVYDKAVPPIEAVQLLDSFLECLSSRGVETFLISGNHDSPERLSFASGLINQAGIHISTSLSSGNLFRLEDEYGPVWIHLLPFIKPAHVRSAYPGCEIATYTDAVREAVARMDLNPNERQVVVAHQFVTGAHRSESEELSLGGSDNVDVSVFHAFDYVALGHLHRPQHLERDTVRYSGTPLKYSFSECHDRKSVTVVELKEKGNVSIRLVPLVPLRDMREMKGSYDQITSRASYEGTNTDDYVHITLTDEDDVLDAAEKLRVIYPNLMKLDYDNRRTRNSEALSFSDEVETKTPLDLFTDLYYQQNGTEPDDDQLQFLSSLIESVWGQTPTV